MYFISNKYEFLLCSRHYSKLQGYSRETEDTGPPSWVKSSRRRRQSVPRWRNKEGGWEIMRSLQTVASDMAKIKLGSGIERPSRPEPPYLQRTGKFSWRNDLWAETQASPRRANHVKICGRVFQEEISMWRCGPQTSSTCLRLRKEREGRSQTEDQGGEQAIDQVGACGLYSPCEGCCWKIF